MPTSAIDLVRTLSRVRSASRAVTAAEMAPAPCRARPMTSQVSDGAQAATALPMANRARPPMITGLRPMRSDAMPSGTCSSAWVRP